MSDPFVGEIRLFGFPRVPTGWLACDGSSQSIAVYEALFILIGTTYGGDGVNTFNLPDLRGRVPISQGTGRTLTPRILGEMGGEEGHVLIDAEMPSHSHSLVSTTNPGTTASPGPTVHLATVNPSNFTLYAAGDKAAPYSVMASCVAASGNSEPHDNMMPTLTCNFCICYAGIFPSQD